MGGGGGEDSAAVKRFGTALELLPNPRVASVYSADRNGHSAHAQGHESFPHSRHCFCQGTSGIGEPGALPSTGHRSLLRGAYSLRITGTLPRHLSPRGVPFVTSRWVPPRSALAQKPALATRPRLFPRASEHVQRERERPAGRPALPPSLQAARTATQPRLKFALLSSAWLPFLL